MSMKFNNYNERERHNIDVSKISVTAQERDVLFKHLERLIAIDRDISGETKADMLLQLLAKSDTPDKVIIE